MTDFYSQNRCVCSTRSHGPLLCAFCLSFHFKVYDPFTWPGAAYSAYLVAGELTAMLTAGEESVTRHPARHGAKVTRHVTPLLRQNEGLTDRRTDGRTDGRTDDPETDRRTD